ncbi:unnamed protein product [Prunus armeniaca]|uniref:Uncharacterized protein n=1 Tax=Prunus armeniaca TaxID=36596 RepID=A0A6J5TMB7_PRUAR|nr:unnamed protein product [Prunus armeniaca]
MGPAPIIEELYEKENSRSAEDEQVYEALVMKGKRKLMGEGRPIHNTKKNKASLCPSPGVSLRLSNRRRNGVQAKSK